ncbi:MAG: LptF/LptG family permease [Spirochaetales bacterium]|nr:LptF/LptG family permease [Spirochaetales bacterium]
MVTRFTHPTLSRYISKEFALSFFVSFLFFFLMFFLNQLLVMARGILAKGIPLGSVLRLMLYSLPSFITLSAPFATLTAALMAYGRFSSDNEILAMRSAGFRRFQIFSPVLLFGILISVVSFEVNDLLLPAGTKAFQRLWIELSLTHPGLEIEPFSVRTFKRSVLITGAFDEEGIHPMMIIERTNSGDRNTIMSRLATPDIGGREDGIPTLRLHDVLSLEPDSLKRDTWSWTRADSMDYRLLSGDSSVLDQQPGPSNLRVSEIRDVIQDKQLRSDERMESFEDRIAREEWELSTRYRSLMAGIPLQGGWDAVQRDLSDLNSQKMNVPQDHSLQVWKLEFYQKYAIPFACIPFVVLAFPLGLTARRSGRAVGFFIGLLLTSFYWGMLVLGRNMGLRTDVSPFLVMVVPDLLLLGVGVILYTRRSVA